MDSAGQPPSSATDSASSQPSEPLAYRAVRGGFWSVVGSYFTIGFGFIANIALIRLLTPAIYGEFALAMFFVTLFDLLSKSGLNYAFAHHRTVNGETLGTLLVLSLLMGAGSLALAILSAPILIAAGYAPSILLIVVILTAAIFAAAWIWPILSALESELRFKPITVATSVATVISYLPAFWLALNDLGPYSLVSQTVTYHLLVIAALSIYTLRFQRHLLRMRWRYSQGLARQFLCFGLSTGLGNFISILLVHVDNFILGTLGGTTILGYYDRAYRVAQWPSTLLIPLVGRAAVFTYNQLRDDQARLQRSVTMVLWTSANLAIPIALALFFSAPELVPLLFGAQWTPAIPLLRILLAVSVLRPIWENVWAILVGLGLPRQLVELSLFQLAVLVVAGTLLTWLFSAAGTATAVILMLLCGLALAYLRIKPKLTLDLRSAFGGPLAALVLTVIGYLILVRVIGSDLPLWAAVAWKTIWGLAGFGLLSALVQPKQFIERVLYIWSLWRRRLPAGANAAVSL
jgi:O-antigen/teichoic acid export membrane protein